MPLDPLELGSKVIDALPYDANDQQIQVIAALARFILANDSRDSVFILNGYAGTGKTSLSGSFVRILQTYNIKVVLLAPTGRAAKVFSANSLGHPAWTIHRKIYKHQPGGITAGYSAPTTADNKSVDTIFIVDEASMIGVDSSQGYNLLEDLIHYVFSGTNNRLIFIGDTAQLPPVGADKSPAMNPNILRDMGLRVVHATLTETARQAANSGILFNATRLRRAMAKLQSLSEDEAMQIIPRIQKNGFPDIEIVDGEDLPELISGCYYSTDDGLAQTIVVTRSNRRAAEFNAGIRSEVLYREEELTPGDRLIVARNHYFNSKKIKGLDFIANGDILEVERVFGSESRYGMRFADVRLCTIDGIQFDTKILLDTLSDDAAGLSQEGWNKLYYGILGDNDRYGDVPVEQRLTALQNDEYWRSLHVKYAYAVTCHKAQGGQWDNVFVDLSYIPDDALGLQLYRWLYTAVTRAKKKLFLISPPEILVK